MRSDRDKIAPVGVRISRKYPCVSPIVREAANSSS